MRRIRRVLFATDFSSASRQAQVTAVNLAKSLKASVTVVHVMTPLTPAVPEQYFDAEIFDRIARQTREWSLERLKTVAKHIASRGVRVTIDLREGPAATQINRAARAAHADLIVIGTHGRAAIRKFFLGSVAERVVRTAARPVLTVRGA